MAFLRKKYIAILSSLTTVIALFSTKDNYIDVYSEEKEPLSSSKVSLNKDKIIYSIDSLLSEIKIMKSKSYVDKTKFMDIKNSALKILEKKEITNDIVAQIKLNYILGNAHFYLFEFEKAQQYFNIVVQNFNIIDDYFIQKDTYYILSKIYFDSGDFIKSEDCFNEALNIVKEISSYDLEADLLISRANDLLRDNNYLPEIKSNVDKAISIISQYKTSNQAQIFYNAGVLYSDNLNKILIGTEFLISSKQISYFNNDIPLIINSSIKISENYLFMNNFEGVIDVLSPLLKDDSFKLYLDDSSFITTNLHLITAYLSLENYDEIEYHLSLLDKNLANFQGSNKIECIILTHLVKANVYTSEGNRKKAFEEINKAFEVFNSNSGNLNSADLEMLINGTLGDIHHKFNNYSEALKYHNKALELAQNKGELYNTLIYTKKLALDYSALDDKDNFLTTMLNYDDLLNNMLLKNSTEMLNDYEELYSVKPNVNYSFKDILSDTNSGNFNQIYILLAISGLLGYCIYSKYRIINLNKTLSKLSNIDDATGLYTYDFINKYVDSNWRILSRTNTPVSLLTITVNQLLLDDFSPEIISYFKTTFPRKSDIVSRNSYVKNETSHLEDFLIVLFEKDKDEALTIADKIYTDIYKILSESFGMSQESAPVLIGISTMIPSLENTSTHLFNRSYEALYYTINNDVNICHIDNIVDFRI